MSANASHSAEAVDERDRRAFGGVGNGGEPPVVVGGDAPPEVVQRAGEQRHQLVLGVLAEGAGDLGGVDLERARRALQGPWLAKRSRTPVATVK